MVSLKDIGIKDEYRSDTDDIVEDFFIPCLANCTEYHRCTEMISSKALIETATRLDNITDGSTIMRIVVGHRLSVKDMNVLVSLFADGAGPVKGSKVEIIQRIKNAVRQGSIQVRIAMPNAEHVMASISERIGIFKDADGSMVAFTGTFKGAVANPTKGFEAIDVFTSWNDMARVERKMAHFEQIWQNKAKYLELYDFAQAEKMSLLKYSADWLMKC